MPDIITIGETMVSFVPNTRGALRYCSDYKLQFAGAESNVAIGASKLGVSSGWISRLGEDEFGHFILNQIRAEGVDTKAVCFDTKAPTGIMFKELSVGETSVTYYRENSAMSKMTPKDLLPEYFRNAKILHLTGITPILSPACKETILKSIALAKEYGVKISFDPNVRKKLWRETDFSLLLREIALEADIVMLGCDEGNVLFGTANPEEIIRVLTQQGNAMAVAVKAGASGAWVGDKENVQHIPPYPCHCIEPIGAGDGFNAAFLSGRVKGYDLIHCAKMGAIAGALATQVTSDVQGYPTKIQMECALQGLEKVYR